LLRLQGSLTEVNVGFVPPWVKSLVSNKAHRDYPADLHQFLAQSYEGQSLVVVVLACCVRASYASYACLGREEDVVCWNAVT